MIGELILVLLYFFYYFWTSQYGEKNQKRPGGRNCALRFDVPRSIENPIPIPRSMSYFPSIWAIIMCITLEIFIVTGNEKFVTASIFSIDCERVESKAFLFAVNSSAIICKTIVINCGFAFYVCISTMR